MYCIGICVEYDQIKIKYNGQTFGRGLDPLECGQFGHQGLFVIFRHLDVEHVSERVFSPLTSVPSSSVLARHCCAEGGSSRHDIASEEKGEGIG